MSLIRQSRWAALAGSRSFISAKPRRAGRPSSPDFAGPRMPSRPQAPLFARCGISAASSRTELSSRWRTAPSASWPLETSPTYRQGMTFGSSVTSHTSASTSALRKIPRRRKQPHQRSLPLTEPALANKAERSARVPTLAPTRVSEGRWGSRWEGFGKIRLLSCQLSTGSGPI